MAIFDYHARDDQGQLVEGQQEGSSVDEVLASLAAQGLYPISASVASAVGVKKLDFKFWKKKLKPKDLATFTRQFEIMYSVGLPLDKILNTLAAQAVNEDFKKVLLEVKGDVSGGMRLSQAFARHPQYFNHLYINMVEVGDVGGILNKSMAELAKVLQSEYVLKQRMKSAMLYPKIVVVVLGLMLAGMLIFVFPKFEQFYSQNNADLPYVTLLVMAMSKALTSYWYLIILFIGGTYYFWKWLKKNASVRRQLDFLAFKVPVLGKLNLMVTNARFAHLISALYRAGLPLAYALGIVSETVDNVLFAEEIRFLQTSLESGESLGNSLQKTKYFSVLIKESCAVGEKTGKLDIILEEVGRFYHVEVEDLTKNFTTLIEPLMLVLLAGIVLFVGMAVYMPIWNMSKVILPH